MKTNKILALAALVCGYAMTLTSCSREDNPVTEPEKATYTVSFENQTLNADGFWIGDTSTELYSYEDGWGGTITAYGNTYTEGPLTLNTTYSIYASEWGQSDYWSGYAISNRTETSFSMVTLTPDQYNSVVGRAHTGSNFAIVQPYGETINFDAADGVVVKGLYFTNSAYTANSIVNGDSYSGAPFDESDWFICTVTGTHADGTTSSLDIELAKNGSYVQDWQYAGLWLLGKVVSLSFSFSGSRSNDYGVLTPGYMCIDDLIVELD